MNRHCPRCDKPTAIVIATKQHPTRMGKVTEEEWRCEDCYRSFKIHSPMWHVFWLFTGVVFAAVGVAAFAHLVRVDESQRVMMGVLLIALGAGAGWYGWQAMRMRQKARPA